MLLRTILLACFLLACVSAQAQAVKSPVEMPNPPVPVVDTANVISDATEQKLDSLLINLDKQAKIEFAVVTVRTTGDQDIFDYSLAVMRGWGIGSADKGGVLLLLAIDDRKYYTQVSRHLEGDLPDGAVGELQRKYLVPQLRDKDYDKAVWDTVQAYVATLAQQKGFSVEGLDQSYAYNQRTTRSRPATRTSGGLSGCSIVFIIIIIIIFLLASRGRGGGGGCLNLFLLGSLLNSGRSSSGWGGGGFGGGSGWGGGDGGGGWGGFSGGGGDAGGGGAGGSW